MAHRGNRTLFPENTLAAFSQAFEDGADILETDLHLSADNHYICIHDASVDRTTNGSGEVKSLKLADIKSLKTLDSKSRVTPFKIPTLEEASAALPASTALALELKTDRFLEKETCQRLGALLKATKIFDRTFALSFSLPRLLSLQDAFPKIPIGWISMTRFLPDKPVDLIGAFWPIFYLNPWYVNTAHKNGLFVCPLDPTPDSRIRFYLRKKVDAVLSDDPGKTRHLLDSLIAG